MKNFTHKINTGLAIALTATVATLAQPQPASAQILEVVSGALGALVKSKQPQPQVIQQKVPVPVPVPAQPGRPEFSVGTNNANGNNFNLCISNCLPTGSHPAPARIPQQVVPAPAPIVQQRPIIQQQPIAQQQASVSSSTVQNGAVTGTSSTQINQQSSSQSVQNVPNIPNVPNVNIPNVNIPNTPAANLPVNLPR